MKKLAFLLIFIFIVVTILLSQEPDFKLRQILDEYQLQNNTVLSRHIVSNETLSLMEHGTPYAMLYEHTGLYRWLLLYKCWFDYKIDTTASYIDVNVQYSPNDDLFKTIPAYFSLDTKRPTSSLQNFQSVIISALKSLGLGVIVLKDGPDNSYGYTGREYCQSFTYGGMRMVAYCRFLQVEDVSCAVYYMTGESYYNSLLYKIFFDIILDILEFKPFTGLLASKSLPSLSFALNQNYPNPFNFSTTIGYSLDSPSQVKLELFNVNGELVRTVVNRFQDQGDYSIDLDLDLPSGVYFYRLSAGQNQSAKRMILIR